MLEKRTPAMLKTTLAIVAALASITLPAMADDINKFPSLYGQFPCSEVRVSVQVFNQTRELEFAGRNLVQISNSIGRESISIGEHRFREITVRVENGRMVCIGVPLDTASPGSWFVQRNKKALQVCGAFPLYSM